MGKGCVDSRETSAIAGGEMTVRGVNTKLYTCGGWISLLLPEDMEGVIRKLSRWYNVDFFFANPSMKQKRFTGSLPKYADISQC